MGEPILQEMRPVEIKPIGLHEDTRVRAADYGVINTIILAGTENALALLPYDRYRRRAVIQINSPNAGAAGTPAVSSTATGAIAAGAGSAALANGVPVTGFTLSFSAAPSTTGTATLSNVTGGPYTFNIPSGQTSPYTVTFPAPITASGPGVAPTLTIAGLGTGAGTIEMYGLTPAVAAANAASGFCLIGARRQVQNGVGGKFRPGNSITIEDVQDLYVTGDGVTPLEIIVLNERYSPYDQREVYIDSEYDETDEDTS